MLTVLVLTESPAFGKSLETRLRVCHGLPADHIHLLNVGLPPQPSRYLGEFQTLYESILEHIAADWAEGTTSLIVVTDLQGYGLFDFQRLNPLGANGWGSVLGMLILALPEVHWVFAGCSMPNDTRIYKSTCMLASDANFSSILEWINDAALCPLFDPLGLRNQVREVCEGQDAHRVPVRELEQAAAIDDEREYAFFHAYVAYRFGFCSHTVTTSNMMTRLFANDAALPIRVIFEDLFLNFADLHIAGLSDLRSRDQKYPRLPTVPMRIIVTTGYERGRAGVAIHNNRVYLNELRAGGKWNAVIPKPIAGVYRLWEVSGIGKQLRRDNCLEGVRAFQRLCKPSLTGETSATGHSTPGRLLEVSKRLLERAASDARNSKSACATIHRALLANDALELLGGKTATTSLVALAQSHELEALAECQFLGVEGDFDVDLRLAALRREIKTLAIFYDKKAQEFSAWNAESSILQRLIHIFRHHNKFNEEHVVLIRERILHRRIWFRRRFGAFGGSLRWLNPAYIIAWYVDVLLRSVALFVGAIALWILVLTVVYSVHSSPVDWSSGLQSAIVSFFSMQSLVPSGSGLFVEIAGLVGLLHVGILIAHLYAVISRR